MPDLQVAFEWQRWATENLLLGASDGDVIEALCEEQVPAAQAEALVMAIRASPIFAAARAIAPGHAELVLRLEADRLQAFEIERRPQLTGRAFHQHVRPANRPVVLPDFLEGSPALETWSLDWFAQTFRGVPMRYRDQRGPQPETRELPVDELVALFRDGDPRVYSMARNKVLASEPFAGLLDDLHFAEGYVQDAARKTTSMWFGPAGTTTPLHFDTADVLLAQIVGRKRIQLVSPACESEVRRFRGKHIVAEHNLEALLETGIPVHDVEVGPGETLFIPVGWYHRVVAMDPSITLSVTGFPDNAAPWYEFPAT